MKITMNKLSVLAVAAAAALICSQARATTITWNFQENGSNVSLGNSSTFVEMGHSITAFGFAMPSTPSSLFAKLTVANPDETGLGMVTDVGADHEIDKTHFVQLDSMISPPATIGGLGVASIQLHEDAGVYGSNTLGVLGTWLTTMTADGSFDLSPWASTFRYFGVTTVGSARLGNVLITSISATTVPDGGTTALLLGLGLLGVASVARRFGVR